VAEDLPPSIQHYDGGKLKRKRFKDEEDNMALFRRVRVKTYDAANGKTAHQTTLRADEGANEEEVMRCICGTEGSSAPPQLYHDNRNSMKKWIENSFAILFEL
jgi:hypothetical protein